MPSPEPLSSRLRQWAARPWLQERPPATPAPAPEFPIPAAPALSFTEACAPALAVPKKKTSVLLVIVVALGAIAFLYLAQPVVLPLCLACVAGMTLKPVIRGLSRCHLPPPISSALVLLVLVSALGIAFVQLGRPAFAWIDGAPRHMTEIRHRLQTFFPKAARLSDAASAMNNMGAAIEEKDRAQTVEFKTSAVPKAVINWTGTFLMGLGETVVLLYLILASGDLFLQKLVHVMPTLTDKKSAVELSHELQQNISNYLFSVSMINLGLGCAVAGGLYVLHVPNPVMWGGAAALLNFVPYFGPVVGVTLLGAVGVLTFDTLWKVLLPPGWYLLLHLVESNLVTPVLLGRRFTLNPVAVFVSLMFWTWLWGIPGALLSVPILVSIKAVCDRFPAMSAVSEVLSR